MEQRHLGSDLQGSVEDSKYIILHPISNAWHATAWATAETFFSTFKPYSTEAMHGSMRCHEFIGRLGRVFQTDDITTMTIIIILNIIKTLIVIKKISVVAKISTG